MLFSVSLSHLQRVKELYFKEWDPQHHSFPDSRLSLIHVSLCFVINLHMNAALIHMFVSSNIERLRDFIKHVYVDRRYSGERSFDKPPRAKMVRSTTTFQRVIVNTFSFLDILIRRILEKMHLTCYALITILCGIIIR